MLPFRMETKLDLYRLAFWLETFVAEIVEVDSFLFINYRALSRDKLLAEIEVHESPAKAQRWLNIVLLNDFITEVVGDEWADDDSAVDEILSVFSRVWAHQIRAKYPKAQYSIEKINDPEYGDLGLRLIGSVQ